MEVLILFRNMRRKKQLLSKEETIEILNSNTAGVLGLIGDDDYPYTVPVSYAYKDNKIFIHSAIKGHKIDSLIKNDKVSFTVIDKDEVIQETFTSHFRSVIIFGRTRIITKDSEKQSALESLVEKYSPDYIKEGKEEIEKDWDRLALIEIKIEHITGKAAIEIINNRKKASDLNIDLVFKNKAEKQLDKYDIGEDEFLSLSRIDELFKDGSMDKHNIVFPIQIKGREYMVYGKKDKNIVTIEKIDKYYLKM